MQVENKTLIKHEIESAIKDLNLNLEGLTILTEAATGLFAYTPIIALMAGAKKVFAVSKITKYGTINEIIKNINGIIDYYKLNKEKIEIIEKMNFDKHSEVDIITNLGHVRPIDKEFVSKCKKGAALSFMAEPWEYRPGDIDIESCHEQGILVAGTNEEHPNVNCFRECGAIATKLIFESKISIYNSKIVILSRDKFGKVILDQMKSFTKKADLISDYFNISLSSIKDVDILVIADYLFEKVIVGKEGIIDPIDLKKLSPNCTIIQLCGHNDLEEIKKNKINIYPEETLPPVRMYKTLADISYKALIRLHTGGLRVGQSLFENNYDESLTILFK